MTFLKRFLMPAISATQRRFRPTLHGMSGKGLGLLIEHLPCCLLSLAAAAIGIPFLNHNSVLELGFAVGGALLGEYIGHRFIFKKTCHTGTSAHGIRRYSLALAIGLVTWGLHQAFLHG